MDIGSRLETDPQLWPYIQRGMEWELDQEVRRQNRLTFLSLARELKMREVKSLADELKQSLADVRQMTIDAKNELMDEAKRAIGNAGKVRSFTKDLKDANAQVEAFLGDSGSNFPPETLGDTPPPTGKHDLNGVRLMEDKK